MFDLMCFFVPTFSVRFCQPFQLLFPPKYQTKVSHRYDLFKLPPPPSLSFPFPSNSKVDSMSQIEDLIYKSLLIGGFLFFIFPFKVTIWTPYYY